MVLVLTNWALLLSEAAPAPPAGGGNGGFDQLVFMFGPILVAFIVINYFLVSRPQRREQQRHEQMLQGLKKNDRVLTAGGVIGTFVSSSEDRKEITLRVDDNTRIKFRSEYIRGVLDDSGGEGGDGSKTT